MEFTVQPTGPRIPPKSADAAERDGRAAMLGACLSLAFGNDPFPVGRVLSAALDTADGELPASLRLAGSWETALDDLLLVGMRQGIFAPAKRAYGHAVVTQDPRRSAEVLMVDGWPPERGAALAAMLRASLDMPGRSPGTGD